MQRSEQVVVAAAVAAGAAVGFVAERRLLRPRLRSPGAAPLGTLEGDVVDVTGPDGLRVVAETYGPPDAPQIVLSHGWVCTGRVWHEQVAELAARYRLVTYDQPGHGRSGSPPEHAYDVDLFGDTLADVVRHATAPGPVVLCGHSLGGMSILNALRRHADVAARVTSVLLLSTSSRAAANEVTFGVGIHTVARLQRLIDRVVALGRPHAKSLAHRLYAASSDLSFLATREFGLSRRAEPRYVDFTEQLLLDSDVDMILGVVAPVLTLDEDEALPALTVPTVVVCGTDDWITPVGLSRRMVAASPNSRLIEVPRCGHMTPLEAHEIVNQLLVEAVAHGEEAA